MIFDCGCESWSGENFVPDMQTFGESAWKLNANCDKSATMYKYVKGPAEIKFKWRKSTAYGSAFEFSMTVEDTKTKLICPSIDGWHEGSIYLSDDAVHKIIFEYKRKLSDLPYCNMDSSAWLMGSAIPNESLTDIERLAEMKFQPMDVYKESSNFTTRIPEIDNSISIHINGSKIVINYINPSNFFTNNSNYLEKASVDNYEGGIGSKNDDKLLINLLWPEQESFLSSNVPIGFNFIPLCPEKIPLCSLFIDDMKKNDSRIILLNKSNKFWYTFNETGMHSWKVSCRDCEGGFNFSDTIFFNINQKNDTTYVDKKSPDLSKFVYATISDAINNVTENGTVVIRKGVFNEQVEIIKSLKLVGSNDTLLDLQNRRAAAIEIKDSNVIINALRITNCRIGILAGNSISNRVIKNITLSDNDVSNCSVAFDITNCDNLYIINNKLNSLRGSPAEFSDAIYLDSCSNWNVSCNIINNKRSISDDLRSCIYLKDCGRAILYNNEFSNSSYVVYLKGKGTKVDEKSLKSNNIIDSIKSELIYNEKN